MKFGGALLKPDKRFLGDFEMLRVARLDIGLVENVVPCSETLMVTWPDVDQTTITILRKSAQEFQIVRGRAVVGQRQEVAGVNGFDRLVQRKGC